ncbi:Nucleotidyltransferase domain protein [uncultured archaeon]|nr:Nucleotidyltransferase domain protein [uncultured archaeon]
MNYMAQKSPAAIRKKILPVLKKHRVSRAGLFGSAARGAAKRGSDVDILVQLPSSSNLFDFIELKQELESTLSKKVDLVEYSSIKPALKKSILGSEVRLYEKAG